MTTNRRAATEQANIVSVTLVWCTAPRRIGSASTPDKDSA
jgi:hypothetical protein